MLYVEMLWKGSGNHVRGRPLVILIASILILSSLFAAMLIAPSHPDNNPPMLNSPARIEYSVHAPIYINDNSGFINASGVVWGSGTASDPFIIEGWDINVISGASSAIYIINTNAFFRIENCRLQSAGSEVVIIYSSNGLISNCTCSNGSIGILLAGHHNFIVNCNCSYNTLYGIQITGYSNNIFNNTCLMNKGGMGGLNSGIYVESNSNTLANNTCSGNEFGFYLFDSDYNTLIDNTCARNAVDGIHLTVSYYNQLDRNNCSDNYRNLTNGDEAGIYLDSSRGNVLTNNTCINNVFSGISVRTNSNSNVLINNTCTNNSYGAYMDGSADNTLDGNNFSGNVNCGIWLHYGGVTPCQNNTLTKNIYFDNGGYGAYITTASNNRFWNNLFVHNRGAGDTYNTSHIQAYDAGTNNWWNGTNGYGNYWSDWRTPDNIAPFGIVDNPYNISGTAGAKDYFPLVKLGADLYPPVTIASLSGTLGTNGWYRSPVTVSLHATDSDGVVNATFYRIGTSGAWLNYSLPVTTSSEGNTTVEFFSMDKAGNNESVKSIVVKIDSIAPNTNPLISGTSGMNDWSRSSVFVTLNPTDSGSGINETFYRIGTSGAWSEYSTRSKHPIPFFFAIEGNSTVQFYSMDNASNNESVKSIAIKIDTKSPITHATVTGSGVTLSASDNVSGVNCTKYRVDSGTWLNYSGAFQVAAAGNHTIEFYSIDNAGNNESMKTTWVSNGGGGGLGSIFDQYGIPIIGFIIAIIVVIAVYHALSSKGKENE